MLLPTAKSVYETEKLVPNSRLYILLTKLKCHDYSQLPINTVQNSTVQYKRIYNNRAKIAP